MILKDIMIKFFDEKKVYPPITRRKVEKAGYNLSEFLLEIKDELKKAEDLKTNKSKKTLEAFFQACEDLI